MKGIVVLGLLLGVAGLSSCAQLVYNKKTVETPMCSMCMQAVATAKARLDSSAKQSEMRSALDSICQQLPLILQSTCTQFVAMKYDSTLELLLHNDAATICNHFSQCASGSSPQSSSHSDILTLFKSLTAEKLKKPAVQDDCSDCQAFVTDVQQRFSDPNQQQQLTDTISNQLCPMLGSVFPQCASYAQEYVPIGLQMFEGLAPSSVCQGINWCSASSSRSAVKLFRHFAELVNGRGRVASASSGPTNDACSDCEAFITDAQKRYADPTQQQVIIDLVANQACPFLSNVFSQCAAYAEEYIPIGFQYLAGSSPQQVCQAAAFCTSVAKELIKPAALLPTRKLAATTPRVGDSCSDCTQFVTDAQQFYSDPQNQKQVQDLITNSLCPVVSTVFADCVQFAEAEVPQLFNLILATDPSVICNYLGLCTSFRPARRFGSGVHRFEMKSLKPAKVNSGDNQYCQDCQTFFTDFQQYLNNPNGQQFITDELVNQVCPLAAQQFPECSQVLTEYLPFAFAAFESITPSLICTQLNFCSASSFATLLNSVPKAPVKDSSLCTDCRLVVEALSGVLQNNDTVNELATTVANVCNIVAEAGRPMCTAMLNAAFHELVYTFQHATDDQVCATFFAQCAKSQHVNVQKRS